MNPVDHAERLIHQVGHVHLVGIGGIGMAGLAWLLHERGLKVSGCDLQMNRQTEWLNSHGISVEAGHHAVHIADSVDWLIRSTAVQESHEEVVQARKAGIPVSRRGDVLPALMRNRTSIAVSGTHGKTTTTAMIAQVLECGYFIGGEVAGVEGIAKDGPLMVVEADESDGSVAGYAPDYAIITNIEYDHMEHHASPETFTACFKRLIEQTRRTVYYCADDRIASEICSANNKCEPYALPDELFELPLPGLHNQLNAAGCLAVARNWLTEKEIRVALRRVRPVRRRFETVVERDDVRVITDYAHHPTEIKALIETARKLDARRLLGVFQPHRYTRTQALASDFPASFDGLDQLWLVPVYAASELPLSGGTTSDLAARFPGDWAGRLHRENSLASAWKSIQRELRVGDVLLIIGAGDIDQMDRWAKEWYPGEDSNLLPTD